MSVRITLSIIIILCQSPPLKLSESPLDVQINKQTSPSSCEDFSDRVFPVNHTCTEDKYVEIYNDTICSGKVYNRLQDDQRYCKDLKAIIQENNSTEYCILTTAESPAVSQAMAA